MRNAGRHPAGRTRAAHRDARRVASLLVVVLLLCTGACAMRRAADVPGKTHADEASSGTSSPVVVGDGTAPVAAARRDRPLVSASIATGNARETDFQIGRELATVVAPDAGIALDVLTTKGSADNLRRVTDDAGVDLAIVQYDVIQAYIDEAGHGNAAALHIVRPLRIVMPLYTEEMYFIVRNDSPLRSIHEIRGKRINVGVQGGGAALTVAALYRRMFHGSIAPRDVRYLTDEEALAALTVDRSVDVVAIVAAQPARLFTDMKIEARGYIKLLALDARDPTSDEALRHYFPAKILARNYPSLLTADVPTLSVMSFLVTSERRDNALMPRLAEFARSMCSNLATLRSTGHPKWREVEPGRRFGQRWPYAATSQAEFERCASAAG